MYSLAFEKAFMFILKWEGGYVNDPDDPGGETKYGISKRQYPDLDIKNLTIEQAKEIYWKDYWLRGKCDKIEALSQRLAFLHFNYCVNTGISRAGKFLQKALRRSGFDVVVDGLIGQKTLEFLENSNRDLVYEAYNNQATLYYTRLVQKRRILRKFYFGWMNRVTDAYLFGLTEFET